MKDIPLFSGLDADELQSINGIAARRNYRKGELIFSEGDPAEGLFVVESGRVKIFKLSPEGKEHVLHIFGPGKMFAEAAMFSGKTYPAFAEALVGSKVVFIPKGDFLELIKESPALSLKMLATLSLRLRIFTDIIEDLSLKEVSARMAKYLLDLSVKSGDNTFQLDTKKSDLALRLGTTGETLSRTLRKFKDKGIVDIRGKEVSILRKDALQEISAGLKI